MPETVKRKRKVRTQIAIENRETLTIEELATRWGVSSRTIRRKVEAGIIPTPVLLDGYRWFKSQIAQFELTGEL